MNNPPFPNDNHVVRYVRLRQLDRGAVDGSAFVLRENERGLSVNWLQAFGNNNDHDFQLQQVRRLFRLKLSTSGRFARLHVGETKRLISEGAEEAGISIVLDVVKAPSPRTDEFEADPSHAEITGVPPCDSDEALVIGDLISECVTYPLYPGKVE